MKDARRYTLDNDWLWARGKRRRVDSAAVRATVSHPLPRVAGNRIDAWLATITEGSGDSRWRGGWAVEVRSRSTHAVVLDLISGGEDVADSLSAAIDDLQDFVQADGTTITWAPQPIRRRRTP